MAMNFDRIESNDKVLIMEGAQVLGDVVAGEGTAFWYNSVCRGEMQSVRIGKRCNIQDCAVIHNLCTLGDDVSVGHGAIVHGATVGDRVIVGMGAIVLNGAKVGSNCLIGAGALVPQNVEIPDGSLAFGSPAKIKGQLDEAAIAELRQAALDYQKEAIAYKAEQEQ